MTRAIMTCFHLYQPFGQQYYRPLLDFFLASMKKYEAEYDQLYLNDSNWEINPQRVANMKVTINRTDPSQRYYDTHKEWFPKIKEDAVLFLDNDSIIYKEGVIDSVFKKLEEGYQFASIFDTIGPDRFEELNGQSKVCPYLFAAPKVLLERYTDSEWGPMMPEHETLGGLTRDLIKSGAGYKFWEFPEDKSNLLFDGTQDGKKSKDTGFYHIRAGSTVAYLLAEKQYGNPKTYWDYLRNQPIQELLRHCGWYTIMGGDPSTIVADLGIPQPEFDNYIKDFKKYHGL